MHSRDVGISRSVNAISINHEEFLLTVTAGEAIHLSREAGSGEPRRCALPDWFLSPGRKKSRMLLRGYDHAAFVEPRWVETILCGRQWIAMVGFEDGDAQESDEEEPSTASCRRCLRLMDRLFPEPDLDDRFELVVQVTIA